MPREYNKNGMLKSRGIVYFPPVKKFEEALKIYEECGGMILSLEEDGFLVDEPVKIAKLYQIPSKDLELYFREALNQQNIEDSEIDDIINKWYIDEKISEIEV